MSVKYFLFTYHDFNQESMMKKILLTLLSTFLLTSLQAQDYQQDCSITQDCCESSWFNCDNLSVEGRVGFFIPLGKRFRSIYSEVECLWGLEANYELCDCLAGWFSVSYLGDRGRSLGLSNPTRVSLVPVAAGLKYFIPCECAKFYLGGGFQYTRLHTMDDSPFVIHKVNHWDWGLMAKAGAIVPVSDSFYLDFFTDYSYLMMDFRKTKHGAVYRHRPNLSSVNFGIGIGYKM